MHRWLLLFSLPFLFYSADAQTSVRRASGGSVRGSLPSSVQNVPGHDLHFDTLAKRWDEAIPLGNGMIGALVWQKEGLLRFSLDRSDLWDLRPMKGLHRDEFSYRWVMGQIRKKEYGIVQQYFDAPYDNEPAPSRIPGGALEFDSRNWGGVTDVHLSINTAICNVQWKNGIRLTTFVHATDPVGWFRFEHVPDTISLQLIAPRYQGVVHTAGDPVGGDDLSRLGYPQGTIQRTAGSLTYVQQGWGGFEYTICVRWKKTDGSTVEGVWSISTRFTGKEEGAAATRVEGNRNVATNRSEAAAQKPPAGVMAAQLITNNALLQGLVPAERSHLAWWKGFWNKSAIQIPDSLLERQWYLEQYKFGSASRRGAPPISLQAVWTADNGRLPPWKGDYHHDLNTQLSYWPCYSANHLEEGLAYFDHLDQNKANYKRYTKQYFGSDGLAVPGVTTLDGTEMGGWIQYSLSPTASCWLAHHYYLQWRYSMDREFLKNRAYPWIRDAARLIEQLTVKDSSGYRQLPYSSSPEINDNDLSAWFPQNTNYDLALMKFVFKAAGELAGELGINNEKDHWDRISAEFGGFALSASDELKFAPSMAFNQSHRHFSNLMAIHPLGLLQWDRSDTDRNIISHSIHLVDSMGPDYWCGYSYAWMANLKAREKDGAGAANDLRIFAKAFCSINSFHLNGDQTKSGLSKFTYRPFTLEGNFAFAAGLQEMLLQSYEGAIELLPAVPPSWTDLSFSDLRAEGAFLVSLRKVAGQIDEVKIVAEKGGKTRLKKPFRTWFVAAANNMSAKQDKDGFLEISGKPGGSIVLKNGYE